MTAAPTKEPFIAVDYSARLRVPGGRARGINRRARNGKGPASLNPHRGKVHDRFGEAFQSAADARRFFSRKLDLSGAFPMMPTLSTGKHGHGAEGLRRWEAIGLLALTALVYGNSLQAPFLFDDMVAVVDNPTIKTLWSTAVFQPPADGSTTTGRPVVNFTFALNHALSGNQVWSYHAFNVAVHAFAALLLAGIVRRTFSSAGLSNRFGSAARPLGLLAAALWALHPLQTESVVCVAQRTESLCGFFYLLTLYGFVRGTDPVAPSRRWLGVSVASCLLGMGTKEVMVTAPVLVFLYDRTFRAGSFASAWRQHRAYFAALACTWLLLAGLVLGSGGARGSAAGFGRGVSSWNYLLTQADALILYLRLSFWPHPLVLDYGTGVVNSLAAVWWQGTLVLMLLTATIWALVRRPVVGFLGAWFFLILAPSSSVVPLVTQTMAEHRMYLPLAAVICLLVAIAHERFGRRSLLVLGCVTICLGGATAVRNRDYRDVVTIWRDNVAKRPDAARGHNNLAWALQQQGQSAEANEHFARAIALQPDYITAYYSFGVALLEQGRSAEAVSQFEAALRLAPRHADAHLNLGNALMQAKRSGEAIYHYEEALRLRPASDAHYNLGVALLELRREREAGEHFREALKTNPNLAEAHYRLALIADRAGRVVDAERGYGETLRLSPNHAAAHANLGLLLAKADRLPAAAQHLLAAVQLTPGDPDVLANLGNVLLLQGQVHEAIARYEEALKLRPNDPRTRENLQLAREALR